jgi:hypothetical protein
MSWSRRLFGGHRRQPVPRAPACRPRLERLESRDVPNASVAFSSTGAMVEVAVYDNGSLVQYDSTGAHLLASSGIRVAHAFRDPSGGIGLDVVYQTGMAFEYDFTGGHFIGPNVLDLSRAYQANGDFVLEVVYGDGSNFGNLATGPLVQYTRTTVTLLNPSGVYFATAYLDANRQFGLAVGTIDAAANILASVTDSLGGRVLYNGSAVITQALGDYDQVSDPTGRPFINTVYNPANAGTGSLGSPHTALQFSSQGVASLGINVASR